MILSFVSLVRHAHLRVPAPLLTVLSLVLLHMGSAGAVHLFAIAGPLEVTWLRLSWAALLLFAVGGRPCSARHGPQPGRISPLPPPSA